MADIDTDLIGKVFNSLPYAEIFGAPLAAAISAQEKASNNTASFLLRVGFEEDKDSGVKKAINVSFEHTVKKSDGTDSVETITMPLIAMIPIPCLMIESGTITLDVDVSQSAEVKENINAGGELEGKVGWGPFSVSLKAKASYSKENTRKTDTRAKQHIELKVAQCPLPEGMNLVLEQLRNGSLDKPTPNLENPAGVPAIPAPAPAVNA